MIAEFLRHFMGCERSLECHCTPILATVEEYFQKSLIDVFSFSISCFVSEIFRFLKHAKQVSLTSSTSIERQLSRK